LPFKSLKAVDRNVEIERLEPGEAMTKKRRVKGMGVPAKAYKRSGGDAAHAVIKVALSAIPKYGGAVAELFSFVVMPPLEKRKAEWAEKIEKRFRALEQKGVNIRALQDDPEFVDVILQATQIALRTSVEDKKKALLNAVRNSASGILTKGALRFVFLRLIEDFTSLHLKFLVFASSPEAFFKSIGKPYPFSGSTRGVGALSTLIESAFGMLDQPEFYKLIWSDLYAKGLIDLPTSSLNTSMSVPDLGADRVSPIGKQFLEFIKE
jgi:hypothetical protein